MRVSVDPYLSWIGPRRVSAYTVLASHWNSKVLHSLSVSHRRSELLTQHRSWRGRCRRLGQRRLSRFPPLTSFRETLTDGIVKTSPLAAALIVALAFPLGAQDSTAPSQEHLTPFAVWTGRRVIILPAQFVLQFDSLGWAQQIPDTKEYLASFDAELTFALTERGLAKPWVMSTKLPAEYKRMPDYMADPFQLAAEWMRYPGPKKAIPYLPDPLAGQLRSILAVNDRAEYVLLPIEIRFEPVPGGGGRAVLRAAIIDPRRLKTPWMGDIYSDIEGKFSPALLASLAEHLANLFVLPQR